jgi:hypothetical protein
MAVYKRPLEEEEGFWLLLGAFAFGFGFGFGLGFSLWALGFLVWEAFGREKELLKGNC